MRPVLYTVMTVVTRHSCILDADMSVPNLERAFGLGISVKVGGESCHSFCTGREYQVRAISDELHLRAAEAGFNASHVLLRRFSEDVALLVAIPTYKRRNYHALLAATNWGASESRIAQLGERLFRSLFPTPIRDITISRIFREHLPRAYIPTRQPVVALTASHA